MGLHDPFGYLKHKLWPKERPKVNLTIWLPTTKSRKSPWFTCMKVAWKALNDGYNFASHLTSIEGLHEKLWASKVAGVPILGILGLLTWESRDKMAFGCKTCGQAQRILKGEGGDFPQVWVVVSLMNFCLFMIHLCTKNAPTMH